MNKRDPSGNRDVRGSKEVRDGGLQVRVLLSGPQEQSVWKWGSSTREQVWTGGEKVRVWSAMKGRRESERRSVENGGEVTLRDF